MGCPVDKVTKRNGGSRLRAIRRRRPTGPRVVEAVRVPVTAKIRLGWDESAIIVDWFPALLADAASRRSPCTAHAAQRFRGAGGPAGHPPRRRFGEAEASQVTVIGNGDVRSPRMHGGCWRDRCQG